MQRWLDVLEARAGAAPSELLAAQALYVLELTALRPDWADWSPAAPDGSAFAAPEAREGAPRAHARARGLPPRAATVRGPPREAPREPPLPDPPPPTPRPAPPRQWSWSCAARRARWSRCWR